MHLSRKLILSALALTLISGCSLRVKNLAELAERALTDPEDATLTQQEMRDYPYAANYLQFEGLPRVLVVLNFDDNNVLKWRSGGEEVFMTQNGRLVGTVNVPFALAQVSNIKADPLVCISRNLTQSDQVTPAQLKEQCPQQWQSTRWLNLTDKEAAHYATYQVTSTITDISNESLTLPNGDQVSAIKVTEEIRLAPKPEQAEQEYTNTFWLEKTTGRAVKTHEWISPKLGYMSTEEVQIYSGANQ